MYVYILYNIAKISAQDIHHVVVPIKDKSERRGRSTMRLPFLMPHEVFDYLYATRPANHVFSQF